MLSHHLCYHYSSHLLVFSAYYCYYDDIIYEYFILLCINLYKLLQTHYYSSLLFVSSVYIFTHYSTNKQEISLVLVVAILTSIDTTIYILLHIYYIFMLLRSL